MNRVLTLAVLLLLAACSDPAHTDADIQPESPTPADDAVEADAPPPEELQGRWGLPGWNVLGPQFQDESPLDGMTFEWDYFSIHDGDGEFTGIIGYLVANPRQVDDLFGNLVPKGGNVAIAGRWADGTMAAEYRNFGYDGFEAGAEIRSFVAEDTASGDFGRMDPDPDANTLRLQGRTTRFQWDLTVSDGWPALTAGEDAPEKVSAADVGALMPEQESWTVDVIWPATRVAGTITDRTTGTTTEVEGVGYRENSFGRWGFNLGGWDFYFLHDPDAPLSLVFQTYHYESTALDFVDLAFQDGEALVVRRFMAGDGGLEWWHEGWRFDAEARQCFPTDIHFVAQDDDYRLEAVADVGDAEVPILSDATAATSKYVIFELFPHISGTVSRTGDGAVVTTFGAQGGGEFSVPRTTKDSMTDAACAEWGAGFAWPLPAE
jgi:hypothetical protein